jgi:haloalkane dehalogenase
MNVDLPQFLRELYPFKFRYVSTPGGAKMHYIDEGFGEPVLFLHGYPTWSFIFRDLIGVLRPDFRCIAIDHIGYGLSDKPRRYKYEIKTHIDNAIYFAKAMKFKKFHIVAEDFGVQVALAMAEYWPERISSMSFLNSSIFANSKLPPIILFFKFPPFTFLFARLFNAFPKLFFSFGTNFALRDDVLNGYLWPYKKLADRVAISAGLDDIPWLQNHRSLHTISQICEKIVILANKKIKFFWGENDFLHNIDTLNLWKKVLPNAVYNKYQNADHLLLEDSKDAIRDIRLFINGSQNIEKHLFKSETTAVGRNRTTEPH